MYDCPVLHAPLPHKFTGKERDSESGLDNFGARYDSSSMGRFMSPDPKVVSIRHIANPQKWNEYAYTINNPLTYFDPDGQEEKSLLAKIADIFHIQGSTGVGLGVTGKVSGVKVGAEASMKSQIQVSAAGNVTVSVVKEAGVSMEVAKEAEIGYKKGTETVTVKDNKPLENFETKSTDVVGIKIEGRSGESSSSNAELAGASVCVGLCVGVSVGVDLDKAGVAASAIGDSLVNAIKGPPPTPQPPPPPSPCVAGGAEKCP